MCVLGRGLGLGIARCLGISGHALRQCIVEEFILIAAGFLHAPISKPWLTHVPLGERRGLNATLNTEPGILSKHQLCKYLLLNSPP